MPGQKDAEATIVLRGRSDREMKRAARREVAHRGPNAVASHEAAHAVAAVLLGLPLVFTDVRTRKTDGGYVGGCTLLAENVLRALHAESGFAAFAARRGVQIAAGITADLRAGLPFGHVSHCGDWRLLVGIAVDLGLGASEEDAAVGEWAEGRVDAAENILVQDDGAAWDRVRVALVRKKSLTGDEVRVLVGETTGGFICPRSDY